MFGVLPYVLIALGVVVLVAGTLYSVTVMRREQHRVIDKGTDPAAAARHPVAGNSILLLYIVAPVAAIVGGMIWVFFRSQAG